MQTVDTIVIGAGIAGASVAWQLVQPGAAGQGASVLLLDVNCSPVTTPPAARPRSTWQPMARPIFRR